MNRKNPLVIRQSRITVLIALFVCLLLLGIGTLSLRGPFYLAAIGFLILITCFMIFVLWSSFFVTIFTSTGLQGRSLRSSWQYSWEQVESWGFEFYNNGEYSIWFRPREAKQRRYIQALGEDQAEDVKAYFEKYCGNPQVEA
jgi:energy-coupling factor transporter transmembrane protein EcfT